MQSTAAHGAAPLLHRIHSRLARFLTHFSLAALGAQVIWGLNIPAMKFTVTQLDPYLMGVGRMFLAGLVLLVVLIRVERNIWLRRRDWPRMMVMAGIGLAVNACLWQNGLYLSTASNAALLINAAPVFAMLLALVIGQERLVPRRMAGMVVALLGIALVIESGGISFGDSTFVGNGLLIGAAFTWATYNVVGVPLLRRNSPLKVTTWAMIVGSATMAVFSPLGVRDWDTSQVEPLAWLGLGYTVIFGSVVAQLLWTRTVQRIGASGTMIYSYLAPVFAVSLSAILLGDRVSPIQIVGAVFVLTGVTISVRTRMRIRGARRGVVGSELPSSGSGTSA